MRLTWIGILFVAFAGWAAAQSSPLQMSVLPNARSGQVNTDITFFATIVNSSETEANSCRHTGFDTPSGLPDGVTGTVEVFALDPQRNIEGTANSFFTIPAGGQRDLLVSFNIDAPMQDALFLNMRCQFERNEFRFAPNYPGVNDFGLTVRAGAGPDIVMIGDTLSGDGVMRVGAAPRTGLFVLSAINIGDGVSDVIVSPRYFGFTSLNNLVTEICETDLSATCVGSRGSTVEIENWANGEVRTFAAFFRQSQVNGIPFFPDIVRAGIEIGFSSEIPAGLNAPADQPVDLRESVYTSSALNVQAGSAIITEPADISGIYQCATRISYPLGASGTRQGGAIVIEPAVDDSSPATATGYLRLFPIPDVDETPDPYLQPLQVTVPDRTISGLQEVNITLHGMGPDAPILADTTIDGTFQYSPYSHILVRQNGSIGADMDMDQPTLTRCVAAPSSSGNPPDPVPEDSMLGRFEVLEAISRQSRGNVDIRSRQGGGAEVVPVGTEFQLRFIDIATNQVEEDFSLPEIMMAWMALGAPSTGPDAESDPAGIAIPGPNDSDTQGQADCAVVVDLDSQRETTDDAPRDDDATVRIYQRPDIDLNEGECVL